MKPKILFLAYKLFDQILENQPIMTGCYQWIRIFNSDYKNWKEMEQTKSELEKYDIIHINADPMDLRLLSEVRSILGYSSSTKIVINQDHAPELWDNTFPFISEFQRGIADADFVFATSPYAQALMQLLSPKKKIHLIPHPCETHVLKKFASFIKNEHILFFWHRYDHQMVAPYLITKNLPIPVSVVGYMEDSDPNPKIFQKVLKWNVFPYMKYPDFIKVIKEARIGYDPFFSYSYGRIPCDCACLGLPIVCSEFNYSSQICYPKTCVNPYDAVKSRNLLKKLIYSPQFYEEVQEEAYEKVEFFNHKNSKERFMKMIENAK